MGGVCDMQVRDKNGYKILAENPKGNRPLERAMHKWECNIKMNLKANECKRVNWIHFGSG
jgi:hypothetical protein